MDVICAKQKFGIKKGNWFIQTCLHEFYLNQEDVY